MGAETQIRQSGKRGRPEMAKKVGAREFWGGEIIGAELQEDRTGTSAYHMAMGESPPSGDR
jgi:hypothetical protein